MKSQRKNSSKKKVSKSPKDTNKSGNKSRSLSKSKSASKSKSKPNTNTASKSKITSKKTDKSNQSLSKSKEKSSSKLSKQDQKALGLDLKGPSISNLDGSAEKKRRAQKHKSTVLSTSNILKDLPSVVPPAGIQIPEMQTEMSDLGSELSENYFPAVKSFGFINSILSDSLNQLYLAGDDGDLLKLNLKEKTEKKFHHGIENVFNYRRYKECEIFFPEAEEVTVRCEEKIVFSTHHKFRGSRMAQNTSRSVVQRGHIFYFLAVKDDTLVSFNLLEAVTRPGSVRSVLGSKELAKNVTDFDVSPDGKEIWIIKDGMTVQKLGSVTSKIG